MNAGVLLGAALAISAPSAGSTTALSLQEVLQSALAQSEDPRIAKARIRKADAAVRSAWASLLPTLSLSGTYRRRAFEVVQSGDAGEEFVFQANDAFSAEGRIRSTLFDARTIVGLQAAEIDRDVAQSDLALLSFTLAHRVAEAYIVVWVAQGALGAARRRLDVALEDARSASARRDAGLLANVDADRAMLESLESKLLVTRGKESVARARIALGLLVGGDVVAPLRGVSTPRLLAREEQMVEEAQTLRPDIRAARSRLDAARHRTMAPLLGLVPALSLDAVLNATNETGFNNRVFNWNVALTVEWVLYDGGLRYAQAQDTSADLEIARLELRQLERMVRAEIQDALAVVKTLEADNEVSRRRVDVARRYAGEVRLRGRRGLATAVEIADAAVAVYEAEVSATALEAQLAQAVFSLRRSAGQWPTLSADEES